MKETISAMMDGELDDTDIARAIASISSDKQLDAAWGEYHLIGDAMRANRMVALNVREQVASRLADEPTVLAPRRWLRPARARTAGAVALAASVSFAAVVGWQQLTHRGEPASLVADKGVPVQVVQPAQASQPERDDPYLLAHQEVTSDQGNMKVSYGNGARR
ncbi:MULTISPECIES: sigma-E factor negative regulatory protein [Chromobacterium]|uniref:Anti-sigma 24 factor n=1 Tax=Chromobacterium haemolyticum TaxID=394935 RepID=A0A1W0CNG3_9NEIS|nr:MULTISPECIES: RseA family anti-sigma factor [Chromobacterium]OQS36231.1 anti-sigma 24 factor [Chromobacterium haemolyticum]QOZ83901.1 anti-sigma 24 factor [Chromobacterium sp. Rain0013]UGA37274.1 sigma-E factor negative regulatory protein [Chromobacterium haemolyticum]WON84042.1 sigma-E factor negative regulatory protein [Chromobacterium haemolyticum]